MTKIAGSPAGGGNKVRSADLVALGNAPATSHSATEIVIDVGDGSFTFKGTGFSAFDPSGIPGDGTVTGFVTGEGSQWSNVAISASALWTLLKSGDVAAFNTFFFSGNDAFVSHNNGNSQDGDDNFFGFGGNDIINMQAASPAAYANLSGGDGKDAFQFAGNLNPAGDKIDGGSGKDSLTLNGDCTLTFQATTMVKVEVVKLAGGHSYALTTDDANVASGKKLTIDGHKLGAGDVLTFDGAGETGGRFVVKGGAGDDSLTGGLGADTIQGGNGADQLSGGAGHNIFVYAVIQDSLGSPNGGPTGSGFDTIAGFDALTDNFDLWFGVTGIDPSVTTGRLQQIFFDDDMAAALDAGHLDVHHAALFTGDSGDMAGRTFLVVEANGTAGYQSAGDLVIELAAASNLGSLTIANFI